MPAMGTHYGYTVEYEGKKRGRGYVRAVQAAARKGALAILGGKCVRCGFDDERALQFDHVNGGGKAELSKMGNRRMYYARIIRLAHTGKWQLLCANCNWIKRDERKERRKRIDECP